MGFVWWALFGSVAGLAGAKAVQEGWLKDFFENLGLDKVFGDKKDKQNEEQSDNKAQTEEPQKDQGTQKDNEIVGEAIKSEEEKEKATNVPESPTKEISNQNPSKEADVPPIQGKQIKGDNTTNYTGSSGQNSDPDNQVPIEDIGGLKPTPVTDDKGSVKQVRE